jgi:hypothetical protein
LFASISNAAILKRYDPNVDRQDLLLIGFGELTLHALDVKGNSYLFERSNPWLGDGNAANYRTSLFANGHLSEKLFINGTAVVDSRINDEYRTPDPSIFRLKMSIQSTEPLWDGWRFTGEGLYDPQRQWEYQNLDSRLLTQPRESARLELLARLESDDYGYIEGGSLHPSFKNSKFTLHRRSLFGIFSDLHSGPVGMENVAGRLEGKNFREGTVVGIRADGTSGPFDLSFAPVTRGSEQVKIETRDRFNESTILSTEVLTREIDYNIDYERGRILLHQPVASESVSSDPVYIVITYDYQRSTNDDLAGSRVRVQPVEDVQASVSYLHRFRNDDAIGSGEEEPEDLIAGDINFDIENGGKGYLEIAGGENSASDDNYSAVRAGFSTDAVENLAVDLKYQRIEDQFRSFTNSDLNPTKNQQRIRMGADFKAGGNQVFSAGFGNIRGLESNGQYNTYPGERNENIFALGYRNRLGERMHLGLKLERRDIEDKANPDTEDKRQQRAILDFGGEAGNGNFLGRIGYDLHYELITFRNQLDGGTENNNTNQVALSLSSRPSDGTKFNITQKFLVRKDIDVDSYDNREDATFVTARLQPRTDLSTLATLEYKRFTVPGDNLTFWQDDPNRIDRAGTFAVEYIPLKKIKAIGKITRHEIERIWTDSTSKNTEDFLLGQIAYFHNHHLSFDAESEYQRIARCGTIGSRDKLWDLGLRMNWNRDRFNEFNIGFIRRWQLRDNQPAAEIKAISYILLAGGSMSLGKGFFARGSFKAILLKETVDDEKTHAQFELGYENPRWYRVSVGYERIEGDVKKDPDRYYRGQGVFMRLTGKI